METTNKVLFPILFTAGVAGNSLNLIVLNSQGMRTNTNRCLSALAVADLCFFLTVFPLKMSEYEAVQDCLSQFDQHFAYMVWICVPLINWFSSASIWLTVAVTTERMLAVSHPLHAQIYMTTGRIIGLIIAVYMITLGLNGFQFVWFEVAPVVIANEFNDTEWDSYGLGELQESEKPAVYVYKQVSMVVFACLIIILPFCLICIFGGILLSKLRQSSQFMAQNASFSSSDSGCKNDRAKERERKVSITVIATILSFLVANLPSAIILLFKLTKVDTLDEEASWVVVMSDVSNNLVTLNKASNFILYSTCSFYFRRQLIRLFCGCCQRMPSQPSTGILCCIGAGWIPSYYFERSTGVGLDVRLRVISATPEAIRAHFDVALKRHQSKSDLLSRASSATGSLGSTTTTAPHLWTFGSISGELTTSLAGLLVPHRKQHLKSQLGSDSSYRIIPTQDHLLPTAESSQNYEKASRLRCDRAKST